MRKYVRDQIINLIPTIWDGIKFAKNNKLQAETVLCDCYTAVKSIDSALEAGLSPDRYTAYKEMLDGLKAMLEYLNMSIQENQSVSEVSRDIKTQLNYIKKELETENEVKLEVVFMPYKVSMWDSLESIWRAAAQDPQCDAYVVPIPYYDRNPDQSFGEFHYEGGDMPDYVPVTHFECYNLSIRRPDIIYIHNPYDEYNFVTSVDPRFYSYELKKYTDMLVYVPYFIAGAYDNIDEASNKAGASAIRHADKVIAQNELHRDIFIKCGCNAQKAVALGSPKLDYYFYMNENPPIMPYEWKKILDKKKVFLLNFTISTVLGSPVWISRYEYYIDQITQLNDIAVIWRPHPLMEATLKSMRPNLYDEYIRLLNKMSEKQNVILDFGNTIDAAFYYSDALITDYSSLMFKYFPTKKPIFNFSINPKYYNLETHSFENRLVLFDYYSAYFFKYDDELLLRENATEEYKTKVQNAYNADDGIIYYKLLEFVNLVLQGDDPLKEARIEAMNKSILNADGTCGEKIHTYITKQVFSK
jgi:CDP-glycerol glycerophosphotransferase (TagB/SpsB family)